MTFTDGQIGKAADFNGTRHITTVDDPP